ncbi:hypothetical protein [Cryobacterium fucosi]|uniref:Uncharacterized protein n=1 Tax=Cryobacterium fucosi TaxID=1259157 RepID=A0A4R9B4K1_9MICO|nr:hypothetical protein [Cryobacterium fucosi]TFD75941.1 hypothetical protein E3T48_10965 [Cryobacterium fucosi]
MSLRIRGAVSTGSTTGAGLERRGAVSTGSTTGAGLERRGMLDPGAGLERRGRAGPVEAQHDRLHLLEAVREPRRRGVKLGEPRGSLHE